MSKMLTLTATGLAGVVLGTGIGIAAAGDTPAPPTDRPVVTAPMDMGTTDMGAMDMSSMDQMHASMRDQMPAEMVEQHDEMHAAIVDHMGDGNRPSGVSPQEHAEHHLDGQEG